MIGGNSKEQLRAMVARIENLEAEKKTISDDIRDLYAESKANGMDVKALRAIIRERKLSASERQERETILDSYRHALGMLEGTIFEDAARANTGVRA